MISPDPGLPLGWGGGALPALASQGIHYEYVRAHAYYLQMSSWLYGKLHEQYCVLHSCTGSLALLAMGALVAAMSAATAPIPMLRTHSYIMVQPFVAG